MIRFSSLCQSVLICGPLLLWGCSAGNPLAAWNDTALAERVRTLSASADAKAPTLAASSPDAAPAEADAAWYVDAAIRHSPEVRAARQRVARLAEQAPQVEALPDPMASVTAGRLAQTAAGEVQAIVSAQQAVPFPGTLRARGDVARQEVVVAQRNLDATVRRVVRDVRQAYWSLTQVRAEREVLQQNLGLLDQVRSSVESRLRFGEASQNELLRVGRETATLENRLTSLTRREATASAMLRRAIGSRSPAADLLPTAGTGAWTAVSLDRGALVQQAIDSHPSVEAARARAGVFRQQLQLARKERLPDFTFGAQWAPVDDDGLAMSANGEDQVAGTVGISIPLWREKYDAAERAALRGMGEALAEVQAVRDRVAFEVDQAVAAIEADQQILQRLRERLMPDARQMIDVALAAYRTGEIGFAELLDRAADLLGDQLQEAQLVAGLHRAMADLEQATGERSIPTEPSDEP